MKRPHESGHQFYFLKPRNISLKALLAVPIILQVLGTVALVGLFSYRQGHQAIEATANQYLYDVSTQVKAQVDHHLQTPFQLNAINAEAIRLEQLDVDDLEIVQRYFWVQMQQMETIGLTGLVRSNGTALAIERLADGRLQADWVRASQEALRVFSLNSQGDRDRLTQVIPNFDPQLVPGYIAAVRARQPTWSPVFSYTGVPTMAISAASPIYNEGGTLEAVLITDLHLALISQFLQQLPLHNGGQVYLFERSGLLVASSKAALPYRVLADGQLERIQVTAADDPVLRSAVVYLSEQPGLTYQPQQFTYRVDGQYYFAFLTSLQNGPGLDWLLLVTMPEANLATPMRETLRNTVLLCFAVAIASCGLAVATGRWLARPIQNVSKLAHRVAQGQLQQLSDGSSIAEINQLSRSFNDMVQQLQASFRQMESLNQALSANESHLTQLLEALPVGVAVHQPDGQVIYFNSMGREIAGVVDIPTANGDALSQVFHIYRRGTNSLYPTEDLPAIRALRGETLVSRDLELHQGAKTIPLELRATPLYDPTGQVIGAVVIFTDISEELIAAQVLTDYRQQLERQVAERTEALRQSEERWQLVIKGNDDAIWDWDIPTNQVYRSPRWFEMLGYSPDDIRATHDSWQLLIHPDDRPRLRTAIQDYLNRSQSVFTIEYRIQAKDGHYRWVMARAQAQWNAQGQPTRMVGSLRDITSDKLSEQALRDSEAKFRALFNQTLQLAGLLDLDGTVIEMNQTALEIMGTSREEVLGRSFWQLKGMVGAPETQQFVQDAVQRAARGECVRTELRWRDTNGNWIVLDFSLRPITNQQGQVVLLLPEGRDVSDRKAIEEKLRLQNEQAKLIREIVQTIRQSLNLNDVLSTTVTEIRRMLQADRVLVCQVNHEGQGRVVTEALATGIDSVLQQSGINTVLHGCSNVHKEVIERIIDNPSVQSFTHQCDSADSSSTLSQLMAPIRVQDEWWGLLVAHQCSSTRHWQDWEADSLKQLADQVGIAIQQGQLFQKMEQQAQREKTLNQVIKSIRSSLELDTVFSRTVDEVARLLQADDVHIMQYREEERLWRNVGDYHRQADLPSSLGLEVPDVNNPLAEQVKNRKTVRIDDAHQFQDWVNHGYAQIYPGSWLLIPLTCGSALWGSLSLSRNRHPLHWEDWEVELVEAVADQLAIAIQQSELYRQLQSANAELQRIATIDGLTQVANRRYLDYYLNQEWVRLQREKTSLAILMLDIDYFKAYNDTYGHIQGDECLRRVAAAIQQKVKRPADLVARYGGEEFAIVLPKTSLEGALSVAEEIRQQIWQLNLPHSRSEVADRITVSIGVACTLPHLDQVPELLINRADAALYRAKARGRNQSCIY